MSWYRTAIWSAPALLASAVIIYRTASTGWQAGPADSVLSRGYSGNNAGPPCRTTTALHKPPKDAGHVALNNFSYCGGTLHVTAFVRDLGYDNKAVIVYFEDRHHKSTPLTALGLTYGTRIAGTDYEFWEGSAPVHTLGVSRLLKLTYELVDVGQTYVQQLHRDVVASGESEPSPAPLPSPYITPSGLSEDITSWLHIASGSQISMAKQTILENMDPRRISPGVVVAGKSGPSYSNKDPDYEYTWVRDTALTYEVLGKLYHHASKKVNADWYASKFFEYAASRAYEQSQPRLRTGSGEVKFYLNNTIFRGPWGRPQNDGPASAASTLTHFIEEYTSRGGALHEAQTQIYDSEADINAPLRKDLLFVAQNWSSPCFDLWEEESSDHFYTRMVQRRALMDGVSLARKVGDIKTAATLTAAAKSLTATLAQFWDADRSIILYSYGAILHGKTSYKDVSVVLAVLHGWTGEGAWGPTDDRVLSTVLHLALAFLDVYPVATSAQHDAEGHPLAVPIGRYPEDIYDGYGMAPDGGNPWFLATSAVAELFFLAVKEFRAAGQVAVTDTSAPFWTYFAPGAGVEAGHSYGKDGEEFAALIDALLGWADAFLRRVKFHAGEGGHLSEQFNRHTGLMQGCADLTWSYAALISAALARAEVSGDSDYARTLADLEVV